jgi:integrase
MADRINFTKEALDKITCPPGQDRVWTYDLRTPGLAFLLTNKGARSFYLYRWHDGRPMRLRLGGYPELTIEIARKEAAKANGKLASGINPQAEKRRARTSMTLAELFHHYIETHAKHHKRTWQDDQEMFERYFGRAPDADKSEKKQDGKKKDKPAPFASWRNRRLNTITETDVKNLHVKLGANHGKYAANRVLALLSAMFNNAKLANPGKGVQRFPEQSRERFLEADELPRFFQALVDEPNTVIRDFILVAILTGARRSNVQSMAWTDVKLDRGTWLIPQTKTGSPQTVHLAPAAVKVLKSRFDTRNGSPFVFPGCGKTGHLVEPKAAWGEILNRAGLKDLRIHDLRRTLGSWQAAGGASLPIIGKSLGHRDGSPATAIYSRLNLDPVKQSVNAATGAMEQLMPKGLLPDETKQDAKQ